MRVICGTAKGRRLKSLKGGAVRPTADRVKEALFSILPQDLSGRRVLDLFAGTGNLSLEALSRGAGEAYLVDQSRSAAQMIRDNLAVFGFAERARVRVMAVPRAVRALGGRGSRFDLIFVDPPYDRAWIGPVLAAIAREAVLAEHGVLVVEHSTRERVGERYGTLELRDQRRYGSTQLSFFGHVGTGRWW